MLAYERERKAKKPPFGTKIKQAQEAALDGDWKRFKKIFEKDKTNLLQPFDLFDNTAIHAAARFGKTELAKELLEMLPEYEVKDAMTRQNCKGNTILHEAMILDKDEDVMMVSSIIDFYESYNEERWEGTLLVLEIRNNLGETPLSRAARFGNLKMIKQITEHIRAQHDANFKLLRPKHFPNNKNNRSILHGCVLGLHFDVAIWLVTKVDENLAKEKDDEGLTCLHLLAVLPIVFRSKATKNMGTSQKLIYKLLPEEGYELASVDNNMRLRSMGDIESSPHDDEYENPPKRNISTINFVFWKPLQKVISIINFVFWKLAQVKLCGIHKIWEQKRRHKFAEKLLDLLVKTDDSWLESYNDDPERLVVLQDLPANIKEKRKEIEPKSKMEKKPRIKEEMKKEKPKREEQEIEVEIDGERKIEVKIDKSNYTPLFLAAGSGIIEVVEKIIKENPGAISHVSMDGLNILHMAVKHRQLEIFQFIERSLAYDSLKQQITVSDSRTILHQAASMEFYRDRALPGVAYELQDELVWFQRIKDIVPPNYLMHCDINYLAAGDVLDIEHAEMHNRAKIWMKETAQSCSTVAVLIAGVVFAAAYAIPGGSERGTPVFHHSPAFHFFTTMDVVALASSLGSVVMFLSILTSSFDMWDFHKSLPLKLRLGFLMLFFSLISTMLAFAATILLTIRMEGNKKTTTFIYSLAFIIVSIFGLTQFPLYKMFHDNIMFWKMKLKAILG